MIRLLLLLLALATPAAAQVTRVISGEHPGFSRLLLSFPAPQRWSLRRDDAGYVLQPGTDGMRYDLSAVFARIPRDRLSAIWAEPGTGALRLKIGCACHATAYDLRPGLLVIDLRDGPPPPGSPFESAAANGAAGEAALPALAAHAPRRPVRRPAGTTPAGPDVAKSSQPATAAQQPYQWRAANAAATASDIAAPALPAPAATLAGEAALRAAMLAHLARGASRGVVEMALPAAPAEAAAERIKPMIQVRVNGEAGLALRSADAGHAVTGDGATCPAEAALALADWGDGRPVAEALSRRTGALTGEFDRPDPAAIADAVRYLLHLGFGAEARQIMAEMAPDLPERPLWDSLAHILDDDADPAPAFAGREVCDGAAALWAVLSAPKLPPGAGLQRAAVLRSFSALPLHLRRDLGPRLASRFLAADDPGAARAVQEAILRAPGGAGPAVDLMSTQLAAAEGRAVSVERLDALGAAPGAVGVEATLMAVEAALAGKVPPDPALANAVEALLREYDGAEEAPALRRATALMRALGGDAAGAFALADTTVAHDIWQVLAERSGDGTLLAAAVGATAPEGLAAATRRKVAARLLGLGLPEPALAWLGPGAAGDGGAKEESGAAEEDLALAAQAHLAQGDGRRALRLLEEPGEPSATRAEALQQLGDPAAAEAFAALADAEGLGRARRAAGDWAAIAAGETGAWAEAAALASPAQPPPDEGPLARGTRLVAEAGDTRARLASLLSATAATP